MFDLSALAGEPFPYPWNLPLGERIRTLARGRRRVAYFYELADNSTFRYRIYNMAQVLNHEGDVSAAYFFLADLDRMEDIAELADVLVICRVRYDHRVHHLVNAFHRRGKKVLFDVDDLVFNPDYLHLLTRTLDVDLEDLRSWDFWFAYFGRVGATLRLCDGAITTNEFLARQIADYARIPVAIVPNFLNEEQLQLSDRIFEAKGALAPGGDGSIHLGYFSGSPSHNRDFAIAAPALEAALEENPRLAVAVAGYIEPGPLLQRFGERVRHFPFVDYVALQRLIGSVEFNLMPLQANTFTNCKSELKYFEAAVVGTLSIASPTFTYARAIRHGDNGYLAAAHEWLAVIRRAVDELPQYRAAATRAREHARAAFHWQAQRPAILAALGLG